MIEKVEVRNTAGDLLTLYLDDLTDGFLIADIDGLDPVKATIVSSSFATMDGTQYQSSKREERNLLFKIGLEPDYVEDTVRELRTRLYGYFMPKKPVSLKFFLVDGLEVDISGRVESCETNHFTKEPMVDISILCFNPDFVDMTPIEIEGETVEDTDEIVVDYVGDVETGILFVLNVDRVLTEFSIYHRAPDDSIRTFDFAANLETGDVVTISTVPGQKYVNLLRTGTTSSILYAKSPQSNWIQFERGENGIRVFAEGDEIPYTITYYNRYGGL